MRSIRQVWPYPALFDGAQFGGNGSPGVTGSANIAKEFRVNRRIRADEVRVVRGEDSTESVVMPLHDALDMALDEGLDLVEVGPNQNPPVVRILDYGRFKFIQSKKQREARKISRSASRQKDVRLSPVMSDNDIETKIITTEDPIEYDIDGLIQVPVNPDIDVTFANVLRAILRHDPDKILVGEIRDYETAEIAIQSSLTGHLVFSTLHTNDAPTAITRLRDMGIPPFLITATLEAILAQRLVRRICSDCRTEFEPRDALLLDLHLPLDQARNSQFY
ncbi:MAG: translation initiation factor IF-3, partial [Chloroflexi bacterium]|nr:translation initiation factor IF-3 [Chloroflexota bacterium]